MIALRQNVIVEGRPWTTLTRAIQWLWHCLVRTPATVAIGVDGPIMKLTPRLRRYGSTSLFMKRLDYEPELAFLSSLCRPGDVVLDIGANFGVYSLVLGKRLGEHGLCYAFEPGREALLQLRQNLALNVGLRIQVVPVALSDVAGRAPLFHTGGPTTFSLAGTGGEAEESVTTTTLDGWVGEANLNSLRIIKIDVEGHEPEVFAGGRATLEKYKPVIMFEVSASALARGGQTLDASWSFLKRLGYEIHRLEGGALTRLTTVEEGNLFAVHPGHAASMGTA